MLPDRSLRWQQWTNRALFDEQGSLLGYQAVGQDITERKRIEALEQDRRNILELIAHDQPLEHILETVVQMIEGNQPGLGVSVLLLRDGRLYQKASLNLPEACIQAMDNLEVKPGAKGGPRLTIWSQTIYGDPEGADDEDFISKDIAVDPRWQDYGDVLAAHRFTASVVMPIKSGSNEIFGVLAGFSKHAWQFEGQIINLFDAAAPVAGLAIERQRLNERLVFQAMYDELTSLPNRHLMQDRLQQDIADARRKNTLVGLLFFDLNRFRNINETLGHAVGDELLKQISCRFSQNIRQSDTLARIGNDNFVVILTDIKTITDIIQIAYKLLDVLKSPYEIVDHDLYLDARVGVSIYPRDGQDVESLIKNADIAQAFAKTSGRSEVECYEPAMSALAMERLQLANRLRRGIERGELRLYYQPQINIGSGAVVGLEALLRWQHPDLGIILPGEFISLAEESGLLFTIGEWVLQEVCNQINAWQQDGITPVRIAINVSPIQFSQTDLIDGIIDTLKEKSLSTKHLAIEITENIFMNDVEAVAKRLLRLREQGVKIFLDDFGTAYSSLAYLRGLPLDYIKIDKTFVDDLAQIADFPIEAKLARQFDPSALVKAIITLAHGLNMKVVAEGVEKGEQLKMLTDLGCDLAQGFLIARPMPADQILKQCFKRN